MMIATSTPRMASRALKGLWKWSDVLLWIAVMSAVSNAVSGEKISNLMLFVIYILIKK